MEARYGIKNFRVFGKEMTYLDVKPITMITGCNSSGKSSIVKSMVLMRDLFKQIESSLNTKDDVCLDDLYLDLSTPELKLGSLEKVINHDSKSKSFTISYSVDPEISLTSYNIEIEFGPREGDRLKRGWINSFKVIDAEGATVLALEYTNGKLIPKCMSLSGVFQIDCNNFISLAQYLYVDEQIQNYDYGVLDTDEDINDLRRRKESMSKLSENVIISERLINAINRLSDKDYNIFAKQNLSDAITKNNEFSIALYFPVFEQFIGKNKSECIDILRNEAVCPTWVDKYIKDYFTDLVNRIVSDFEESKYDSFLDYYRALEDEDFDNIVKNQQEALQSQAPNSGIISNITMFGKVYFDSRNNIRIGTGRTTTVSLNEVYKMLGMWSFAGPMHSTIFSVSKGFMNDDMPVFSHNIYDAMMAYFSLLMKSVLSPNFFGRLKYIGNFHSEVKRLYSFEDKDNSMSMTIKEYLETVSQLSEAYKHSAFAFKRNAYKPLSFVNKWLKKIKIGSSLVIEVETDGLGAKLFILRKRIKYPLADEGYGFSQLVNFLLHIEVEILHSQLIKVLNLGPASFNTGNHLDPLNSTLAIEEPEVSLHPSLQSMLTDIFVDAYKTYGIQFIIETHSEYLIRRSQAMVSGYNKEQFMNRPFSVFYVQGGGDCYELEYTESGRFNNSFGPGFFDEASRSSIKILKKERRMRHE